MLCSGACIAILIHRGLHGYYGLGIHGFNISLLFLIPSFLVLIKTQRGTGGIKPRTIFLHWRTHFIALLLSLLAVVYYLSTNGLWCAQHPSITKAMCKKLRKFSKFARSNGVKEWWLTMGDLLAVQRGLDQPLFWEHDIDICITSGQFIALKEALKSNPDFFHPKAEYIKSDHLYLPIDIAKLRLLSTTKRTAEGVNLDIWTCPRLVSNITRVSYCGGFMNVPMSELERRALLKEYYGDYSVVKYSHHAWMCNIWTG